MTRRVIDPIATAEVWAEIGRKMRDMRPAALKDNCKCGVKLDSPTEQASGKCILCQKPGECELPIMYKSV